jgi:hypothetical protein
LERVGIEGGGGVGVQGHVGGVGGGGGGGGLEGVGRERGGLLRGEGGWSTRVAVGGAAEK